MNRKPHLWLLIAILPVAGLPVAAQQPDTSWEATSRTIFNALYTHPAPVPRLIIETDVRQLVNQKYTEEYQPAVFRMVREEGDTATWTIKLRTRGNRRKDVCEFPPLKLNFDDTPLLQQGYLPFDKIKIANQCRPTATFADYIIKEYLAYRLYQVVTPVSFRARLVQVTYIDSGRHNRESELFVILLEPEEELTTRLQAAPVEQSVTHPAHLDRESANRLYLFQYMIGNTDWHVPNRHNLITVKLPGINRIVPIPYDFDYAGMVGAPYAVPHEALPIKDVRQRYNKGEMMDPAALEQLTVQFKKLGPELVAVCESVNNISGRAAKDARQYIDFFLEMLDNPRLMENVFVKNNQ